MLRVEFGFRVGSSIVLGDFEGINVYMRQARIPEPNA